MDPSLPPTEADRLASTTAAEAAPLPEWIGSYRVRELLGTGGMGIVYRAEQTEPIHRDVALKVLRRFRAEATDLARFQREIEALATLTHPNIAQVYDAGTIDGSPYFAMELVAGRPITEHANRERLALADRLELFLEVCDGIQHAHQKGLIHRDLKPGNILVARIEGGRDRPKIIDFGLAKQSGVQSDLSVAGTIIGTPSYMSPEQLQGLDRDVDTRTDVYALGVVLFELLAGANPFAEGQRQSLLTLVRRIMEDGPSTLSRKLRELPAEDRAAIATARRTDLKRLERALRGDLDWIVLRALAKDREDRYPTVFGLAEDIRRHLRDEPVTASPPSRRYRVRKFVRRHRGAVLVAASAALLLLFATLGTTIAWRRAQSSERRAVASELEARAAAAEAASINRFLVDLLGSADPGRSGRDVRLLTLLDERVGTLGRAFPNQPKVESSIRHIIGRTYMALGELDEARAQLTAADEIRRRHLGPDAPESLETRFELGQLQLLRGELPEAEETATGLVAVWARSAEPAGEAALRAQLLLGQVRYRQDRYEEAFATFSRLFGETSARFGPSDELTLDVHHALANVLGRRGDFEEAEARYRTILDLRRATLGPDHPETIRTSNGIGNALFRQGRYAEAEAIYREVVALQVEILGADHPTTFLAWNNVGNTLDKQRRFDEAEATLREVLGRAERVLGSRHPDTLLFSNNLGNVLRHAGRYAEAEAIYRTTRRGQLEVLGPAHLETLRTTTNLVTTLVATDQLEAADGLTRQVVAAAPASDLAWAIRADLLQTLDRWQESAEALGRCVELEPGNALRWSELGLALLRTGDHQGAEGAYERMITLGPGTRVLERALAALSATASDSPERAAILHRLEAAGDATSPRP